MMMRKKMALLLSTLVLAAGSLLTAPAFADTISLNLASPVQSGVGGATLSFNATVSAPATNSGTIFLNGDSWNVDSPLTLDDSGFFNGYPLSLGKGSFYSGLLFTVTLPSNVASGLYHGSFSILGGADGNAENVLATVNFNVNVPGSSPSAVPEPGSLLLLGTGLAGMGAAIRRRVMA